MNMAFTWGTTATERQRAYPCDRLCLPFDHDLWRGVEIAAPPSIVFRWLCQLRVAPYSYDWIDNFGRQSPQQWTPGLDQLAAGQPMMTIFKLHTFVQNEHLTIETKGRVERMFGRAAISYVLAPGPNGCTKLIAKLRVRYPRTPLGWAARIGLPWGDLLMIRKQLLNFKRLAERDAARLHEKGDDHAHTGVTRAES